MNQYIACFDTLNWVQRMMLGEERISWANMEKSSKAIAPPERGVGGSGGYWAINIWVVMLYIIKLTQ